MAGLHAHLEPVASLLGTWVGRGHGENPTIPSFDNDETISFGHVGKPVTFDGDTVVIDVVASTIGLTASAKSVTAIERTFRIYGDTLEYTVRMAAVGQPLQHHLAATLSRVG